MRCMRRIAHQDAVTAIPFLAPQPWEVAPDRAVGNKRLPAKRFLEDLGADPRAFGLVHVVEAPGLKCLGLALNYECARRGRESVMMRIHRPPVRLEEGLSQRVEYLVGAEPRKMAREIFHLGPEGRFVSTADQ